ncbi:hypothetical protein [Candidatus Palauibacter sp.]|uniref:hypothetical protein n=1 Tax=Candidatus Palauibacter sp. TaxID=3101350 RepID=UPI003B58EDCC
MKMTTKRSSVRIAVPGPAALATIGLMVLGCAPEVVPEAEAGGAAEESPAGAASPVRRAPTPPVAGLTTSEPGGAPEITYTMVSVQIGAELEIELLDPISPTDHRPGDRFRAGVTRPVIENDMVLVPLNSLVHGEITAVEMPGGESGDALVKLRFSDVFFNGREWAMSASVVEVQAAAGVDHPAGGAQGPMLGRIIGGHREGTVAGAAAGAVPGTAILLSAGEADSGLPVGTILRLRLDEPLVFGIPNI